MVVQMKDFFEELGLVGVIYMDGALDLEATAVNATETLVRACCFLEHCGGRSIEFRRF